MLNINELELGEQRQNKTLILRDARKFDNLRK